MVLFTASISDCRGIRAVNKDAAYYVRVFVDNILAHQINDEISHLGTNVVGLLVQFKGHIPQASNYKTDQIGWRVDAMRTLSADFEFARKLLDLLTKKQRQAVIEYHYWINRHPQDSETRLRTREAVARYIGERKTK